MLPIVSAIAAAGALVGGGAGAASGGIQWFKKAADVATADQLALARAVIGARAVVGAVTGGGVGAAVGGVLWATKLADSAAVDRAMAGSENIKDLLRQKMSEQEVRDQAKSVGVDVCAAVEDYRAAQQGQIDIQTLVKDLITKTTGVPMADAAGSASLVAEPALPVRSERVGLNAEIRRWARENGLDVADKGRIPRRVLDAFREAH